MGEPPTEQELWGLVPDPDSDRPGGAEGDVAAPLLITRAAAEQASAPPEVFPAGLWLRDGSRVGGGFAGGGVLDVLPPGVVLAGFAADAWADGLDMPSDDELIGVLRAWRRLASWAAAGELAAVAELSARREHDHTGPAGPGCQPADFVADELACALTLTRRSAGNMADRAAALADLPATAAALRLGRIDVPKALTVIDGVAGLEPSLGRAVEDIVLGKAPGQTTGELRAAVRRAVLAADPAVATRRRQDAEKHARVELWDEPAGTKALAGRDLPPAGVLAADQRISAIARELKNRGAPASLDLLRAKVYLALLAGQPLDHLLPAPASSDQPPAPGPGAPAGGGAPAGDGAPAGEGSEGSEGGDGYEGAAPTGPDSVAPGGNSAGNGSDGDRGADADPRLHGDRGADDRAAMGVGWRSRGGAGAGTASQPVPAALRRGPTPAPAITAAWRAGCSWSDVDLARLPGSVNLTIPLMTLLGLADSPGEAAGFGPLDAETARILADAAARHPATRWCLTLTDANGRVIGHGCDGREPASPCRPEPAHSPQPPSSRHLGPGNTGRGRDGPGNTGRGRDGDAGRGGPVVGAIRNLVIKLDPLSFRNCDHDRATPRYELSPRLRHLIEIRDRTCAFPGCRRPAARCDMDHTVPYDQGGKTCECNISPLCRTHHRVKQAEGWRLEQPAPGVLQWTTPSGRKYVTGPL